jgi:hypothetical protein
LQAGLVIFAYHHQYRKNWRPPQPSLPERCAVCCFDACYMPSALCVCCVLCVCVCDMKEGDMITRKKSSKEPDHVCICVCICMLLATLACTHMQIFKSET